MKGRGQNSRKAKATVPASRHARLLGDAVQASAAHGVAGGDQNTPLAFLHMSGHSFYAPPMYRYPFDIMPGVTIQTASDETSTATGVAVRATLQAEKRAACASHPMSGHTIQRLRDLGSSSKIFACTHARSAARLHQHAHTLRLREIVDHSQQRHVHTAAAAINHVQNAAIRCPQRRPQRPSAGQHVPVSWRCASQHCVPLPPSPTRSECQREASQVTIERLRAAH